MVTKTDENSKNRRVVRYEGEFFSISFDIEFDDVGNGSVYVMAIPETRRHKSPYSIRRGLGGDLKLKDIDSFMYGLILGWNSAYPKMDDIVIYMEEEGFC